MNKGNQLHLIEYLNSHTYISHMEYHTKLLNEILKNYKEPASVLDILVNIKLRQELNQINLEGNYIN